MQFSTALVAIVGLIPATLATAVPASAPNRVRELAPRQSSWCSPGTYWCGPGSDIYGCDGQGNEVLVAKCPSCKTISGLPYCVY